MPAPAIDESLVQRLVADQFPEWACLTIGQVDPGGWDNVMFRLGERMAVRLPRAGQYAAQTEKEYVWLPKLAPYLPLPIPAPLALGRPAHGYPWQWSITSWVEGEAANVAQVGDLTELAASLGAFLGALQHIDASDGPLPGPHNFHRGGSFEVYAAEAREAVDVLRDEIDVRRANEVWTAALRASWNRAPVWVHGDISPGNLLLRNGRLSGVIDFGMVAVGDPACDLAIAWTFLDSESRESLRRSVDVDADTWHRGQAWALWKAAIVAAGLVDTNAMDKANCWRTINEVLSAYA